MDTPPVKLKFSDLRKRYEHGENITQLLMANSGVNTTESIEIAYELQAGSYSKWVNENRDSWHAYCSELAGILSRYVEPGSSLLDCGTGELTTLCGILREFGEGLVKHAWGFDVSLSRLKAGVAFADTHLSREQMKELKVFCARMENIPLPDDSVDVVFTSHALEPNGGREGELLAELFRVAKKMVIMFEPSWEDNSDEGRRRMESLGYIKGLETTISRCGGELLEKIPVKAHSNPLNPTMAFVVRPKHADKMNVPVFVCPKNHDRLIEKRHFLWSEDGMLAYPVFDGIPVLKSDQAVMLANP